jgi:hypothetical protein
VDTEQLTRAGQRTKDDVGHSLARTSEDVRADLAQRAAHLREEMRGRVESTRSALPDQDQVREVGDEVRQRLDQGLEQVKPVVRRSAPTVAAIIFGFVRGVASLPLVLLRLVGRLVSSAEEVAGHSDLRARAQSVAHDLPVVRHRRQQRRRERLRLAAFTGAGFGVGLGIGWLLGRRRTDTQVYDPALPPVPSAVPPSVAPTTSGGPVAPAAAREPLAPSPLPADAAESVGAPRTPVAGGEESPDAPAGGGDALGGPQDDGLASRTAHPQQPAEAALEDAAQDARTEHPEEPAEGSTPEGENPAER